MCGPLSFCFLPLGRACRRRPLPAWPRPAPRGGAGGWCPSRCLPLPAWPRSFPRLPKVADLLPQKKGS